MSTQYTKWVACWGNATSITDRKECVYAKDITLRYPIRMCFAGSQLRLRFSNLTGTEPITLTRVYVAKQVTGEAACGVKQGYAPMLVAKNLCVQPGQEVETEPVAMDVKRGDMLDVSIYLGECTQMNAGTLITGPLSKGQYAYGDFAAEQTFPIDLCRNTNWFYFLNTIDILTEESNHALVCYGDSITAQSWPDYLSLRCEAEGYEHVSIIRRAVSGTRILRQYDCITYQAYGLKGATRFPIEMNVAGMSAVIIQHGINDIIHPVGTDVNVFRPWSDMPTLEDLQQGVRNIYLAYARAHAPYVKIYSGTLLPIEGWRTYNAERDALRNAFNDWLRGASGSCLETTSGKNEDESCLFDGCVDFDEAVRDAAHPAAFAAGFDSGDHLHPSEAAYKAMAEAVPAELLQ